MAGEPLLDDERDGMERSSSVGENVLLTLKGWPWSVFHAGADEDTAAKASSSSFSSGNRFNGTPGRTAGERPNNEVNADSDGFLLPMLGDPECTLSALTRCLAAAFSIVVWRASSICPIKGDITSHRTSCVMRAVGGAPPAEPLLPPASI